MNSQKNAHEKFFPGSDDIIRTNITIDQFDYFFLAAITLFPCLFQFAEGGNSTEPSRSGPRDDYAKILGAGRSDRAASSGKDSEFGESLPLGVWAETSATSLGT